MTNYCTKSSTKKEKWANLGIPVLLHILNAKDLCYLTKDSCIDYSTSKWKCVDFRNPLINNREVCATNIFPCTNSAQVLILKIKEDFMNYVSSLSVAIDSI